MKVSLSNRRSAFTLIELLVVIAIIAILIGLLLPAIQKVREAADRSTCSNNIKQLGLGMMNYHDNFKAFPVGMGNDDSNTYNWKTAILPFIDQGAIFDKLSADTAHFYLHPNGGLGGKTGANSVQTSTGTVTNANTDNTGTPAVFSMAPWSTSPALPSRTGSLAGNSVGFNVLSVFICPSDVLPNQDNDGFGKSNYNGCSGNMASWPTTGNNAWNGCAHVKGNTQNGILLYAQDNVNYCVAVRMSDVKDGTSNTFLLGERTVSKNAHTTTTNTGQFPIWIGGNNNGGCSGWNSGGNSLSIADAINTGHSVTSGIFLQLNLWRVQGGSLTGQNMTDEVDATFGSQHPGGANFVMADGSVKFITDQIDPATYTGAASRNGRETLILP